MSNRTQHVSYDGHASDNLEITCGVPQGSILGPQLFILYVNDMCNVSKLLKFILFADDTNIFYSHDRLPELVNVLNTELDNMYTWFCVNKLSLKGALYRIYQVIILCRRFPAKFSAIVSPARDSHA